MPSRRWAGSPGRRSTWGGWAATSPLRLSWGKASFLLTGDLSAEGEAYLLRQEDLPLDSTVLKVAHHGAGAATSKRFLEAVTPQVAVISVGAGNRFGHPAPEVLARLGAVGAQVWRTDECGDVEVVTDGERLWVRTGKGRMQPDSQLCIPPLRNVGNSFAHLAFLCYNDFERQEGAWRGQQTSEDLVRRDACLWGSFP